MKKVFVFVLVIFSLLAFAACGDKPELLEIMPRFVGEEVSDIDYQFTKDDFTVYAIYDGDDVQTIDDYEFEVEKMSGGHFHVKFTFGGLENYCYVPCNVNIYPTDGENAE